MSALLDTGFLLAVLDADDAFPRSQPPGWERSLGRSPARDGTPSVWNTVPSESVEFCSGQKKPVGKSPFRDNSPPMTTTSDSHERAAYYHDSARWKDLRLH